MTKDIKSVMSQKTIEEYSTSVNLFCDYEKKDEYKSIISKSAKTFAKCVDPNFVKHVQKLEMVTIRLVDVICEKSNDAIISLSKETIEKLEDDCSNQNQFQINGCVYSNVEIRELMDDRSLISNFIFELLDGNDKKCRAINEIHLCLIETFQKCESNFWLIDLKANFDMILESINCKRHAVMVDCTDHSFKKPIIKIITILIIVMIIVSVAFVIIRKFGRHGKCLLNMNQSNYDGSVKFGNEMLIHEEQQL